MRAPRLAALLLALGLLALAAQGGRPAFGGFVGTAGTTVHASVDSLAQHVTVTVPAGGGEVDLHNPTSAKQDLALRMLDPSDGSVGARFVSSGGDHATLAPGATDTIKLTDTSGGGAGGELKLGVPARNGTLFPGEPFTVPAPSAP